MITGIAPLYPSRILRDETPGHEAPIGEKPPNELRVDGRDPVLLRPLNRASALEMERLARVLFKGASDGGRAILFAGLDSSGGSSEWVPLHMAHALAVGGRSVHVLCLRSRPDAEQSSQSGEPGVILSERCRVEWLGQADEQGDMAQTISRHLLEARKHSAHALIHVADLGRSPEVLACAGLLDGAVLLVRSGHTRKAALAMTRERLAAAEIAVLGGVLTDQTHPIPEKVYRAL